MLCKYYKPSNDVKSNISLVCFYHSTDMGSTGML